MGVLMHSIVGKSRSEKARWARWRTDDGRHAMHACDSKMRELKLGRRDSIQGGDVTADDVVHRTRAGQTDVRSGLVAGKSLS